ncbi:MAG: dTMP kinase [Candidatus Omnitrophica bacterium]|nr:dTMP kinase [Candidatus Omnitrophota bacterium]
MTKAKFITLEGSEGSGKSTQSALIVDYLKSKGQDVIALREPGGVKISEAIRNLLLDVKNDAMGQECETLLYMAARAQVVKEIIAPALQAGKTIVCDRFLDSTFVYQGFGHGLDLKFIQSLGTFVTQGIVPDLTVLFDIEVKEGLSRTNAKKDRIELRPLEYHEKVRQGYLSLAAQNPNRIKLIRVDAPKEEIFKRVKDCIDQVMGL